MACAEQGSERLQESKNPGESWGSFVAALDFLARCIPIELRSSIAFEIETAACGVAERAARIAADSTVRSNVAAVGRRRRPGHA